MTASRSTILATTGLGRSFRGLEALADVNLAVLPGEIVGVIGPILAAMLGFAPDVAARETPVASPAAGPAPSGEPVVIGCIYNLIGDYASLDNPAWDDPEEVPRV